MRRSTFSYRARNNSDFGQVKKLIADIYLVLKNGVSEVSITDSIS